MVFAPAADVSACRPRRLWSPRPPRCTRVRGDLPNSNCRKTGKFVLFQRKMSCGTNVRSFSVDSSGKIWYNYVERASKPCAAPACRPVNRQRGVWPDAARSSFCTHTDAVFGRKTRRVPNQIRTFVRIHCSTGSKARPAFFPKIPKPRRSRKGSGGENGYSFYFRNSSITGTRQSGFTGGRYSTS